MKILLITGPGISLMEPYSSGIEAFIVAFANQLANFGHDVDVVAEEADYNEKFRVINPFINIDKTDNFKLSEERQSFEQLALNCYDIVHYNMFYPHLFSARLALDKKLFLTLHSPPDDRRIPVYRDLLNACDVRFIAISKRIKKQYEKELGGNITLINNGIDIELWQEKKSENCEYLLWSARITEEKNVADAISLAKFVDMPLVIAGRIVNQNYFDEKVKPHLSDKIKYVGHLTQRKLSGLAQRATAYLATAKWQEPFGLAALEMLACGVPVVGYNTAVPPNWDSDGVLTTDTMRWQDLAELILKSQKISPSVCRKFASEMTVQKMTKEYLALYEKEMH